MSSPGVAQVQIQVVAGPAIQQIAQLQAALRGAAAGTQGGAAQASAIQQALQLIVQHLNSGAGSLAQAAQSAAQAASHAAAAAQAAGRPSSAPYGPMTAGQSGWMMNPATGQWTQVSTNAPGRMANSPAALNALVQSQYGGTGGARAGAGGAAGAQSQNLQAQMFDVFTQLGSGASPALIVIQQGPQIIQALGGIGAAAELLKAKLAALGISMQGMGLILGTLGAALTAGALVYRYYARETEYLLELRAAEHASALRLIPVYRQLEDAQVRLLEATGAYSAQEAAAERIRLQAGRSVQDLARAHEAEALELRKTLVEGAKYVQWQRDLARGFAIVTYASQVSTRGLSLEGLRQYAADVEAALDSVTGWAASTEQASAKLRIMGDEVVEGAKVAKEARKANVEADKATRDAAEGKKGAAAAAREQAKAERELAEALKATRAVLADAGRIELTGKGAATQALAAYNQEVYNLVHAANEANVPLERVQAALDQLARAYQSARVEADAAAEGERMFARQVRPGIAQLQAFDAAIRSAYGADKVTSALALADATRALADAQRAGVDPAAIAEGQRQIAAAQDAARAQAVGAAGETASQVAQAISNPLAAIAGVHPIAAAVVAGIQTAADLPDTLNSLTKLFSDAAAGLTIGGPAIAKFVGDLFGSVIPAMVEAADDFVIGIIDNIPAIIEGLAAGIPRLAVAFVELFSPLMAARIAISLARALFDPQTWIDAGKALGQGFLDALAALWQTLRDIVEAIVPGRQFGGERTGLFKGGGVFDTAEYYTAGAIFGRGDQTGLFQSEGWLGRMVGGNGRRNRSGSTTNVYQGGVVVIGSDAPRAIEQATTRYAGVYGNP